MAIIYVAETGGDFNTLAGGYGAAIAGVDEVHVHGPWTADDTGGRFDWTKDVPIIAKGEARCDGLRPVGTGAYRMRHTLAGTHAINRTADVPMVIDGICLILDSSNSSDECIRTASSVAYSSPVLIKNCRFHDENNFQQTDGIYTGFNVSASPHTIESCVFTGFGRGGVHCQNCYSGSTGRDATGTINVNSCGAYFCGNNYTNTGADFGGGFVITSTNTSSRTVDFILNVKNSHAINCETAPPNQNAGPQDMGLTWSQPGTVRPGTQAWPVFNAEDCIVSSDSITETSSSQARCLENIAWADTDQGIGDYIIFESLLAPQDLRLRNLSNGRNKAQDMHRIATSLGLTIPEYDIAGQRRRLRGDHLRGLGFCCGPHELALPRFDLLGDEVAVWAPSIYGDQHAGDDV